MTGELCRRARSAGLVCLDFEGAEPLAVHEDGRKVPADRLAARWVAALRRATLAELDGAQNHERAVCSAAKVVAGIIARPSTEWDRLGLREAHRALVNALEPLEAREIISAAESWVGVAS